MASETVYFSYDDDIINPCWDGVFKAMFTKESKESRQALNKLLSAVIETELDVISITANEPPVNNIRDRQIRYDIMCRFVDGGLANIEMTLEPDEYERERIEYYSCRMHAGQDIRGGDRGYSDLKQSYQISLIVNSRLYEDTKLIHHFVYYDIKNSTLFNGRTNIITIELSKLKELINNKRPEDMSSAERWAVFFKYTADKEKRDLINAILACEEGINMAGQVLMTISRDEIERARLESEYKFAVDLQSKVVTARRIGLEEGMEKGIQQGMEMGKQQNTIKTVKNLLSLGMDPDQIAIAAELSLDEVMEIKNMNS